MTPSLPPEKRDVHVGATARGGSGTHGKQAPKGQVERAPGLRVQKTWKDRLYDVWCAMVGICASISILQCGGMNDTSTVQGS